MTSATSSSAPRFTSTRNGPDHRRLRSPAPDPRRHPAAPALDPRQPRPPELHPQPDQLRTALGQRLRRSATKAPPPAPSTPFQVANCASLPFAPKLTTQITGSTGHNGNPALKSVLTYPQAGPNANVSRVSATLPHSEFLDNAHIKSPCTRVQFSANLCPPGSLLGLRKGGNPPA